MQKREGVVEVDASFIKGQAVITYDPEKTSPPALVQAINSQTLYRASLFAGRNFGAGARQIALQFEVPFDPQRTWKIGTELKELQGVSDVNALADGRVGITFDPQVVKAKKIVSRVEGMGYPVLGVETLSPSGEQAGDGGVPFPYWTASGVILLGIGLFVYRWRRNARRSLPKSEASPLQKEKTS